MITTTIHTKTFTYHGERRTVTTSRHFADDEFADLLLYTRRVMGYAVYPRWASTRLFLAEVIETLRKRGIFKGNVARRTHYLLKKFNALEHRHTGDFDPEFIEVLASEIAAATLPRINALRGAIGGVLMNNGIRDYIFMSYPETLASLCHENTKFFDALMRENAKTKHVDFTKVFLPFRGDEVRDASTALLEAVEDATGIHVPRDINARQSAAFLRLNELSREFLNDKLLEKAVNVARNECTPQ